MSKYNNIDPVESKVEQLITKTTNSVVEGLSKNVPFKTVVAGIGISVAVPLITEKALQWFRYWWRIRSENRFRGMAKVRITRTENISLFNKIIKYLAFQINSGELVAKGYSCSYGDEGELYLATEPLAGATEPFNIEYVNCDFTIRTIFADDQKPTAFDIYGPSVELVQKFLKHASVPCHLGGRFVIKKIVKNAVDAVPENICVVKNFENLFLSKENTMRIRDGLKNFDNSKVVYQKFGLPYKKGYLFYGQPGTGKTATALAIAREMDRPIYKLKFSDIKDETGLTSLVKLLHPGSLLLVEDIKIEEEKVEIVIAQTDPEGKKKKSKKGKDASPAPPDDDDDDVQPSYQVEKKTKGLALDLLLNLLDGYTGLDDVIIIFTSNFPETIKKALIRPGRIDEKIEFKYADRFQIRNMLKFFMEYDISDKDLDEIPEHKFSTAMVIHTFITPNLHNVEKVVDLLKKGEIDELDVFDDKVERGGITLQLAKMLPPVPGLVDKKDQSGSNP